MTDAELKMNISMKQRDEIFLFRKGILVSKFCGSFWLFVLFDFFFVASTIIFP